MPARDLIGRAEPIIVAHRGASGYAPENTLAAFRLAVEMGAPIVECDVHLSSDNVPIIIHDHALDRTTSGSGLVRDWTHSEIARLDAGSWFDVRFADERVLTLDDLLDWCRGRVGLSIELKNGPIYYDGIERTIADRVRAHDMAAHVSVISFDHVALARLKSVAPEVQTGALYAARLADPVAVARSAGANALLPHVAFATPDLVQSAHGAGIAVSVWTVNDAAELAMARAAGVDAVATDFPDRVARELARQ